MTPGVRLPAPGLILASATLAVMLLAGCGSHPARTPASAAPAASASSVPRGPAQNPADSREGVRLPPVAGRFDYQIGGAYHPAPGVTIVDRDRGEAAAAGVYNICYVNAFQTQPDEASLWAGGRASLLLRTAAGELVTDPDWPGEHLLDTSTPARRAAIAAVAGGWIDGCRAAGYAAIEPDNLDSWTRSKGLLTAADNLAMSALLIARAHADGLAIGQKKAVEISAEGATAAGFDFAIAEECQVYDECGGYTDVYGAHVIEIEYTDNPRSAFTRACAARGTRVSVILRDRDVLPRGQPGYLYRTC